MNEFELKNIIEALLMSSGEPLTLNRMLAIFDDWQKPTTEQLKSIINELDVEYQSKGIELKLLASGYVLQTKKSLSHWVSRLMPEKATKYSSAFLEVLAIIAYKQPVTRAEIEEIRGVAVSSAMLKTLIEHEWISIAGNRDVIGKPAVYITTKEFLDHFNLASISDLPPLRVLINE